MRIFIIGETANEGETMVRLSEDFCKILPCNSGSLNLVAARILGFSYPDYLRYTRDKYNATIRGAKGGHMYSIYKNRNDCYDIVEELNRAWSKIEESFMKRIGGRSNG